MKIIQHQKQKKENTNEEINSKRLSYTSFDVLLRTIHGTTNNKFMNKGKLNDVRSICSVFRKIH